MLALADCPIGLKTCWLQPRWLIWVQHNAISIQCATHQPNAIRQQTYASAQSTKRELDVRAARQARATSAAAASTSLAVPSTSLAVGFCDGADAVVVELVGASASLTCAGSSTSAVDVTILKEEGMRDLHLHGGR